MQLLNTEWDATRTAKASVITRPHYCFEWPQSSGEISDDLKKKKKRQNISTRRRIQETTGKVIQQIHLEATSGHTKAKKVTGNIQHRFTNDKSCLTSLTAFLIRQRSWWMRGEPRMLFNLTLSTLLTMSHTASLKPNWRYIA